MNQVKNPIDEQNILEDDISNQNHQFTFRYDEPVQNRNDCNEVRNEEIIIEEKKQAKKDKEFSFSSSDEEEVHQKTKPKLKSSPSFNNDINESSSGYSELREQSTLLEKDKENSILGHTQIYKEEYEKEIEEEIREKIEEILPNFNKMNEFQAKLEIARLISSVTKERNRKVKRLKEDITQLKNELEKEKKSKIVESMNFVNEAIVCKGCIKKEETGFDSLAQTNKMEDLGETINENMKFGDIKKILEENNQFYEEKLTLMKDNEKKDIEIENLRGELIRLREKESDAEKERVQVQNAKEELSRLSRFWKNNSRILESFGNLKS